MEGNQEALFLTDRMHPFLEKILTSSGSTHPFIIDEVGVLELVSRLSHIHTTSLDDCITGSIPGVSLYQKQEDTKHLSVKDIRGWIDDMSESPYEAKHLYILRDFDEATHEAMNTTLKILEEPPSYALIALVVKNPESLLETIQSRTINLFSGFHPSPISEELQLYIEGFLDGDPANLMSYIFKEKIDIATGLVILSELSKKGNTELLEACEEGITHLFQVNETPRYILEKALLYPKKL